MQKGVRIVVTAGALADMTDEQFHSLRKLAQPGQWDTQSEDVFVSGTDYLGVHLTGFFIGIEKDGYAHS